MSLDVFGTVDGTKPTRTRCLDSFGKPITSYRSVCPPKSYRKSGHRNKPIARLGKNCGSQARFSMYACAILGDVASSLYTRSYSILANDTEKAMWGASVVAAEMPGQHRVAACADVFACHALLLPSARRCSRSLPRHNGTAPTAIHRGAEDRPRSRGSWKSSRPPPRQAGRSRNPGVEFASTEAGRSRCAAGSRGHRVGRCGSRASARSATSWCSIPYSTLGAVRLPANVHHSSLAISRARSLRFAGGPLDKSWAAASGGRPAGGLDLKTRPHSCNGAPPCCREGLHRGEPRHAHILEFLAELEARASSAASTWGR